MPFKDKFKKALGIGDDPSSRARPPKSATPPPDPSTLVGRRKPIDPAQKERMEQYAFSEDSSERKDSFASQYSPMGSKLPSRHNSADATAHKHARGPSHVGHEIKLDEDEDEDGDNVVDPMSARAPELESQPASEEQVNATVPSTRPVEDMDVKKPLVGPDT